MDYIKNILISIDQLVNTILSGEPDESLSSRAWRHYEDGSLKWPKILIDIIFFWEDNHCYNSYLAELNRDHLKDEMQ